MKDARMYAEAVKERVSCRELMETAGVRVDRHGFCVCPFHVDSDASLKIYDRGRGWTCYGCHKGGDVINMARLLYGVGFSDAVRRLNDEFSLGFDLEGAASRKEKLEWLARRHRTENARKRAEKRAEDAEAVYWDRYEWWMFLDRMVRETEPARGEAWPPAFRGYLRLRAEALERLKEAEERRIPADERVPEPG